MAELVFSIIVLFIQIVFGVVFGVMSIYLSLRFFDRMTSELDEMKELRKGNVAVAILLAALMIGIGLMLSTGIERMGVGFSNIFENRYSFPLFLVALVLAFVEFVIVVLIAVFVIYTSICVMDRMTGGISEMKEIKKGNVAVALEMAAVILVISLCMTGAISGLERLPVFDPLTYIGLLGL